jgi:hypothetical protein
LKIFSLPHSNDLGALYIRFAQVFNPRRGQPFDPNQYRIEQREQIEAMDFRKQVDTYGRPMQLPGESIQSLWHSEDIVGPSKPSNRNPTLNAADVKEKRVETIPKVDLIVVVEKVPIFSPPASMIRFTLHCGAAITEFPDFDVRCD